MRLYLVTALLFSVAACSDGSQFVGQKPTADEASDDGGDDEEEATTQPIPVSAAYLTCDVAADEAASADELVYGCRLASQATRRSIDMSKIATQWKWEIGAVTPASVSASVEEREAQTGGFQSFYRFTGGDSPAVREKAAKAADIKLAMALKKPIDGFDGYGSSIENALVSDAKVGQDAANQVAAPTITQPATQPVVPKGPDADADGIEDMLDLCFNTRPGELIWKEGIWMGCAEKQHLNKDDADHDRVANAVDICPATPFKDNVDATDVDGHPRRGCGPNEVPPF